MDWVPICKRFVAFIDIAGFKAMVKKESATEIATLLSDFKLLADKQCEEYGQPNMLFTIAISDSIVVFSKDDSEDSFACFCQSLGVIFNNAMTLKLMNAGVAFGDMYVDRANMIFFGEPYIIAYTLQEKMDYYGILCDESVSKYIKEKEHVTQNKHFHFYKKLFIKQPSPLKILKISESSIYKDMQDVLNFKWFDMHFAPTHKFVEEDGIIVGTYYDRMLRVIERERKKLISTEEYSKIEERINNTIEMIEIFSKYSVYHNSNSI